MDELKVAWSVEKWAGRMVALLVGMMVAQTAGMLAAAMADKMVD